ncbi:MAG: lipopolysaccharide heptosyltransferase II [Candidatus Omnitrophica bacterium]|nr:lipopolysaccharide heptosyltransferase II [Candidatus Omnitrophota bacterium]
MKILLITTHLEMGGIPVYVVELARGLKRRGHEAVVVSSGGWLERRLDEAGILHPKIPIRTSSELNPRLWLLAFPRFLRIARRQRPDLIHAHTRTTQVLAWAVGALTGIPRVTTCHGIYPARIGRRLFRCWGKSVMAISKAVFQEMVSRYRLTPPHRVVLVRNGVEAARFSRPVPEEELADFRRRIGLKGGPVIGAIARLSPVKGLDHLLKAMPALLERHPHLQLLLIGEGPSRPELIRLAYQLGIAGHLVIAHSVEETRVPLAAMDLFAVPSLNEGFGLAMVEAMAAGVPVVASNRGGPAEIIEEGLSGLLVPPGDAEGLTRAILTLLDDPALRRRMGQAARERARAEFDLERMIREVETVYREAVHRNGNGSSRRRILIVAVNWMGDLLFMTPAIRAIRRAHPDSFIACLAPPRGLDLLRSHPHLDEVIPVEESRGLKGLITWVSLVRRLREKRFDAAFLFHRSFTRALVLWLAGIRERIGVRTWKRGWLLTRSVDPPPKDSLHKAVGFLKMLESVGIQPDGLGYDVGLLPEDHEAAQAILAGWGVAPGERLVALHAGANWRLKRWPAKNFARVADRLADRYRARVLFVGDRGDLPLVERIAGEMRTRPLIAAGRTTFRQLGALLTRASVLISNDSGPLHLGLAVGTPVVALFGPTDPKLSGPLEESKAVTLFGSIGCPVPCYRLDCPANLCMSQITVEQVVDAAEKFLGGQTPRGLTP